MPKMKNYTATFTADPSLANRLFEYTYRVMSFYPDVFWTFRTVGISVSMLLIRTDYSPDEVLSLQSELVVAFGFDFSLSEPVRARVA